MAEPTGNRQKNNESRRVLLLLTPRTYRARSFLEAAARLEIEVVKAIDMDRKLADYWDYELGLDFSDITSSVSKIKDFAAGKPLTAVVAVDDNGTALAAASGLALGLPHNSPESANAARDKYLMRTILARAEVLSPQFKLCDFGTIDKPEDLETLASPLPYPCVLKPLSLNGSRGVIRVDDDHEFFQAALRLRRLLWSLNPRAVSYPFLVEQYIPGFEVAVEAILDNGLLKVLAIFDKPDPLEGPYFEETIYVTPSRLPDNTQRAIIETTSRAANALGLRHGPVHAELRLNQDGPWIIELAGRTIGGHCSKSLRFGKKTTLSVTLEELVLRQATGMPFSLFALESQASGVMMIPIPGGGLLKEVRGCSQAESNPYVDSLEITIGPNQLLTPLPEGDSYLGFIFASGPTAADVEGALRQAHACLEFDIAPQIATIAFDPGR